MSETPIRTRDELLKAADDYLDNAIANEEAGHSNATLVLAQATLALTCIQLAEAQRAETRSLTVEDVERAVCEELEKYKFFNEHIVPAREKDTFVKAITARLRGGSHER